MKSTFTKFTFLLIISELINLSHQNAPSLSLLTRTPLPRRHRDTAVIISENEIANATCETTNDIMPPQSTTSPSNIQTESSVLGELKEKISNQANEIERLKKALSAATSTRPQSGGGGHGHGAPSEDDPDLINRYLTTPFYSLAARRVSWLAFFLCSLSLTAVIMNGFEHTLSRQIELAYFVPLLAGHGGNTGGQTVGTVLSALSKGVVTHRDAWRVISKEACSGLTVGVILSFMIAPLAHFVGGISLHVSTVVFCTLPLLSTIAATLASSIPLICVVLGLDPAVISAPAMTTFVDVTGLLSYFLIANQVFKLYGLEL